MEKIKLFGGQTYELPVNGVQETSDKEILYVFIPGKEKSFEEIEAEFSASANVSTVYILDSDGETMRAITGYTKYKGMKKVPDYIGVDSLSSEAGSAVMMVTMAKPEVEDRVAEIETSNKVISKAATFAAFSFTDQQALQVKELYPLWAALAEGTQLTKQEEATLGTEITKVLGDDGKLYKVTTSHQKQADWAPGQETASLFTVIDEVHAGTQDDPIPYSVNMIVYAEKFYSYDGAIYKCTRDSEIALQQTPDQLIGNYFEIVE